LKVVEANACIAQHICADGCDEQVALLYASGGVHADRTSAVHKRRLGSHERRGGDVDRRLGNAMDNRVNVEVAGDLYPTVDVAIDRHLNGVALVPVLPEHAVRGHNADVIGDPVGEVDVGD